MIIISIITIICITMVATQGQLRPWRKPILTIYARQTHFPPHSTPQNHHHQHKKHHQKHYHPKFSTILTSHVRMSCQLSHIYYSTNTSVPAAKSVPSSSSEIAITIDWSCPGYWSERRTAADHWQMVRMVFGGRHQKYLGPTPRSILIHPTQPVW